MFFPFDSHCQRGLVFVSSPTGLNGSAEKKGGLGARTKDIQKNRAVVHGDEGLKTEGRVLTSGRSSWSLASINIVGQDPRVMANASGLTMREAQHTSARSLSAA